MGDSRLDKILLNQRRGLLGDSVVGVVLMGVFIVLLASLPAEQAPVRVQSAPQVDPASQVDPVDDYVKKYDPQGA